MNLIFYLLNYKLLNLIYYKFQFQKKPKNLKKFKKITYQFIHNQLKPILKFYYCKQIFQKKYDLLV